MSDVEPTVEAPAEEAFDLDAAVEEFATSAPDEWKGKASKIQSELKGLRERFAPYRDTFDGLNDQDREGFLAAVKAYKSGDFENLARWMAGSAKTLAGERFTDILAELTPAQQEAVEEAVEDAQEAAEDEGKPLTQADIAKLVADAIKQHDTEKAEQAKVAEQISKINLELDELGHKDQEERNFVMQLARDNGGDIKAASERFATLVADWGKKYVQSKGEEADSLIETPKAAGRSDAKFEGMSRKDRVLARLAEIEAAGK